MIRGNRQVLSELLMPFKAVIQLGGVRGVMMYGTLFRACYGGLRKTGRILRSMMSLVRSILCFTKL